MTNEKALSMTVLGEQVWLNIQMFCAGWMHTDKGWSCLSQRWREFWAYIKIITIRLRPGGGCFPWKV